MTISFQKHRGDTGRSFVSRNLIVVVTTALLSSCVVGPDYEKPSFALGFLRGGDSASAPVIQEWWKQFNDPILNALVERAVAQNLDVASAKAKIREARANYRETTGGDMPTVNSGEVAKRSKSGDASAFSQLQAGLDASRELDLFGANRRSKEAAHAGLDAAQESLRGKSQRPLRPFFRRPVPSRLLGSNAAKELPLRQ